MHIWKDPLERERPNLASIVDMPPTADCHPCLPQDLLTKLESDPVVEYSTSYIFRPDFEEFRLGALKLSKDRACVEVEVVRPSTDSEWTSYAGLQKDLLQNMDHFRRGDRKTFLHSAARDGDIPLAHEVIRMGIIIDYKDKEGVTALFLAMEYLLALHKVHAIMSRPGSAQRVPPADRNILNPEMSREKSDRVTRIATLCIVHSVHECWVDIILPSYRT